MKEGTQPFPDFEKPPVVEVVCGVLFKNIDKLLVPHFGQLWERFKPEYNDCQEVAPIAPVIEGNSPGPRNAGSLIQQCTSAS